jgi:hypothetical protein
LWALFEGLRSCLAATPRLLTNKSKLQGRLLAFGGPRSGAPSGARSLRLAPGVSLVPRFTPGYFPKPLRGISDLQIATIGESLVTPASKSRRCFC